MKRFLPGLLLLTALPGGSAQATQEPTTAPAPAFAMLPVRDLTGAQDEAFRLQDLLKESLAARGARFVATNELEEVLYAHRIRETASISRENARFVSEGTGADFLIAMVLLEYEPGFEPRITFGVRTVDLKSGERIQSALVSLSGEDFRGLLGLGVIEDEMTLELEVIARVLGHFDAEARPLRERTGAKRLRKARPSTALGSFRKEDFDPASVERVVVMPLVNATNESAAGLLFAEILGHEWFGLGGVEVVELSELRAALRRSKVRAIRLMDHEIYARVAADLGATHFVLGRLELYSRGVYTNRGEYPAVEASIRLLEARTGRIVAAAAVRRRGDDYHTLLGLGIVQELLQLADRAAREMVALILG